MAKARKRKGLGRVTTRCPGSITYGHDEVSAFRDQWPASGLRTLRSVTTEFDSRGDLVDLHCNRRHGSCHRYDGPALLALTNDMQTDLNARCARKRGRR